MQRCLISLRCPFSVCVLLSNKSIVDLFAFLLQFVTEERREESVQEVNRLEYPQKRQLNTNSSIEEHREQCHRKRKRERERKERTENKVKSISEKHFAIEREAIAVILTSW